MTSKRKRFPELRRPVKMADLLANPTKDVSQLSVTQLKTVLRQNGVPKDEISKMRKAELVHRLQEVLGKKLAPAIDTAKSVQVLADKAVAAHRLCRLRTDLLVLVSHFLDTESVIRMASCDHFLRARMTLAFSDRASPALSSMLYFRTKRILPRLLLQALLSRAQRLKTLVVSVELFGKGFTAPGRSVLKRAFGEDSIGLDLPPSLTRLDISAKAKLQQFLPALLPCSSLLSLSVCCTTDRHSLFRYERHDDKEVFGPPAPAPALKFPHLRTLHISDVKSDDPANIVALVQSAPALQSLTLTNTREAVPNFAAISSAFTGIKSLSLTEAFDVKEQISFKDFTNLTSLTVLSHRFHAQLLPAIKAFPPNLTKLFAACDSLIRVKPEDLPQVTELGVYAQWSTHGSELLSAPSLLSKIESLVIAGSKPQMAEMLEQLVHVSGSYSQSPVAFTRLRRLRLLYFHPISWKKPTALHAELQFHLDIVIANVRALRPKCDFSTCICDVSAAESLFAAEAFE